MKTFIGFFVLGLFLICSTTFAFASLNVVICNSGSTTPLLCWDEVASAEFYRVRVEDARGDYLWDSGDLTLRKVSIPEGVIAVGEELYLRVEARDVDDVPDEVIPYEASWPLFNSCWAITDIYGENEIGWGTDLRTVINIIFDDSADIVESVWAKQPSDTVWIEFRFAPGEIWESISPAVAGQWEVQARDGAGQVVGTCMTDILEDAVALPFVENVQIGDYGATTPTVSWDPLEGADYYRLRVVDSAGNKLWESHMSEETSRQVPDGVITPGERVHIRIIADDFDNCCPERRSNKFIPYVASGTPSPPSQATLISPSGTITEDSPTYTWDAVADSSWYYLWVNDNTGNKIKKWYTADDANCGSGTGQCSVTPTTELSDGACRWWIRTWNEYGYGPWSAAMAFTVNTGTDEPPGKATLASPSGTTTEDSPTYTWNAVADSSWYYLWVNDNTGNKIKKWYTADDANCGDGTGQCSVTNTTELADGSCRWWIQTWNEYGYGPWSAAMAFTMDTGTDEPPGKATLVSPEGTITDNTPTYTWDAVADSSWYYLWVNDNTGNKIKKWYTAEKANCGNGTDECSVTPTTLLSDGSCKWWIQTWNHFGYGPWSNAMSFRVDTDVIPDITGEYSGSYSIDVSNCSDSSNNGTYYAILELSIPKQTGFTFRGSATGTFDPDLVEYIQLSGTISESGKIRGETTHTFLDTTGEGTFTGQLSGNTLSIENSGQDTSPGDTCTYTRYMTATR